MKSIHITDELFEKEVEHNQGLTIVDFWAPWCGPCKMIAPILDELAEKYDGTVRIAKINVDENSSTAQRFGITSIPTLLFFHNGKVIDRIVGALSLHQLEARVNKHLELLAAA